MSKNIVDETMYNHTFRVCLGAVKSVLRVYGSKEKLQVISGVIKYYGGALHRRDPFLTLRLERELIVELQGY